MKMRCLYVALLCLSGISQWGIGQGSEARYFTTRDSISMARFNSPAAGERLPPADFSPDRRYAAIVTSRGLLATNEVESTIWLVDTRAVARFIERRRPIPQKAHLLRPITRIAAVPKVPTFESYGAVVSDLRWSEDAKTLYFLGMDSYAERRLYAVDVVSGNLRALSPRGRDVRQYSVAGARLAYTARLTNPAQHRRPWIEAQAINQDAGAVTGLGIERILYPEGDPESGPGVSVPGLWVGANGSFIRVPDAQVRAPDADHYFKALALAPDGRKLIRLLPVTHVDPSWARYIPKPGFESWRIDPKESYLTSPFYLWRLREYELVDVATGADQPLIRGPHGSSLAQEDASVAVWSKDGRRALIGNVGLPLDGSDPITDEKRERICALAAVDLPSRSVHCVAFTRDASAVIAADNPHPLRLQSAMFGVTNNDVTAHFAWHGQWGQTERYHFDGRTWRKVDAVPGDPISGAPVEQMRQQDLAPALFLRQGLNASPVLWGSIAGKSRALWNPNPQLADLELGKARLFRWRDPSGYRWEGVLILPAGYQSGERYPLVIQTHGYLPGQFVTEGLFPTAMAARELSSAGFVVLQTGNRPDHYVSLKEAEDAIDEWRSAIAELDRRGVIDRNRVGVIGFSRTCWYVERALIEYPHMFAAATMHR